MNNNFNVASMGTGAIEREQQAFLTKVYTWMIAGLAITGVTAWWAFDTGLVMRLGGMVWGLIIAQLALVFIISGAINKLSATVASGLFLLYSLLTGITFSTLGYAYSLESIINVFFIAGGSFAALSFYGYATKKNLSGLGSFMMMGLFGIIIAMVVNIFIGSTIIDTMISIVGVLVFAGLTAYDTQKLKEMAIDVNGNSELAGKAAILGALTLYLDFINLFIMLLRLLGGGRD